VLAELTFDTGRTVALPGDDVTRPAVLTLTDVSTVRAIRALRNTQRYSHHTRNSKLRGAWEHVPPIIFYRVKECPQILQHLADLFH